MLRIDVVFELRTVPAGSTVLWSRVFTLAPLRFCWFLLFGCCRNQAVQTALHLVLRTIPAASLVPFLTIPALAAWTPIDITAQDLDAYARRYMKNNYADGAVPRGVVVQVVNNYQGMAKHFVFVLFPQGNEAPRCDANYRSDFYRLKRLVGDLWATDQHALSSELLHRPCIRHTNPPEYGDSRRPRAGGTGGGAHGRWRGEWRS